MAEDIPEGIRNPKLLTAALDLALACVKCYECPGGRRFRRCFGRGNGENLGFNQPFGWV